MHICFVTTGDIKQLSTAKRATGMAGPLMEMGHRVSIIIEDSETNRERLALECPEATALHFPFGPALAEVRTKRRLLAQLRPDVAYLCAFGARNAMVSRPGGGRPLVVVEHSELRSCFREELGPVHANRERFMEYWSMVASDGLVCASRYLERKFVQRLQRMHLRRPILYSPYAYNESVMAPRPEVDRGLSDEFAGRRVVIYMGAMAENYGLPELLRAMTLLRDSDPDILLLLMGRQRDGQVEQYLADHNLGATVRVMGYVAEDDLPSYFGVAAAFISTLRDTVQDQARCPSKLYMYLPFQRPIVTARIGEAAELLGDHPYYYQAGDAASLAKQIAAAAHAHADWRPGYDYRRHSYRVRSEDLVNWLASEWSDRERP